MASVPGYLLAQLDRGDARVPVVVELFGKVGMLGATGPQPPTSMTGGAAGRLCARPPGCVDHDPRDTYKAQNVEQLLPSRIRAYIALAGLSSSPVSGASMNPTRSFGPDLVVRSASRVSRSTFVGPLAGELITITFASILAGPGGDIGRPGPHPRRCWALRADGLAAGQREHRLRHDLPGAQGESASSTRPERGRPGVSGSMTSPTTTTPPPRPTSR